MSIKQVAKKAGKVIACVACGFTPGLLAGAGLIMLVMPEEALKMTFASLADNFPEKKPKVYDKKDDEWVKSQMI